MDAGFELRNARKSAKLTATKLAQLGGTSVPAISQIENGSRGITVARFDSLLRKTGHRLAVLDTITPTPGEIAQSISGLLRADNWLAAYRVLLSFSDALKIESPTNRLALTAQAPQSSGSPVFDAALAAVVRYWLGDAHVPVHHWLDDSRFSLETPQPLLESEYSLIPPPVSVAPAFLVHNVLLDERALRSV